MSVPTQKAIGYYAVTAAIGAGVICPLLALAYFGIPDGAGSLDQGSVAAWADPARTHVDGLLTWSSPDRVYATYTQALALLFPAVFLCALTMRRTRPAGARRLERVGWRLVLTGYAIAAVALAAVALLEIGLDPEGGAVNAVFLAGMLPGMLLSVIGSNVLGVALVRAGYRPRTTAWLLALALPLMIVGSAILGHNSLGMLPLFLAWGTSGWSLTHSPQRAADAPALARA